MLRLEGKTVLITGAAGESSIGRATALAFADEGADVAINDLISKKSQALELADQITHSGRRAVLALGDIKQATTCREIVERHIEQLGHIDIWVNNAGGGAAMDFFDITEDEYDHQLALNMKGAFFLAQAAAKDMLSRKWGRIINISSELSYVGEPSSIPYCAAKGGIRSMTKAIALALAPDITVNTVAPGPTDTPLIWNTHETTEEYRQTIPLKRLGRPQDVARSVVFLASPDGDAFTGQVLNPNCGVVMI